MTIQLIQSGMKWCNEQLIRITKNCWYTNVQSCTTLRRVDDLSTVFRELRHVRLSNSHSRDTITDRETSATCRTYRKRGNASWCRCFVISIITRFVEDEWLVDLSAGISRISITSPLAAVRECIPVTCPMHWSRAPNTCSSQRRRLLRHAGNGTVFRNFFSRIRPPYFCETFFCEAENIFYFYKMWHL